MRKNFLKVLAISLIGFTLAACSKDAGDVKTIKFDPNTTLETSKPSSQLVKTGGRIKKPSVTVLGNNPDNYKVYAWYTEKELTTEWNFKKDLVEKSMTLYAGWKKTFTVNYYLGDAQELMNSVTVFEGETVKEHEDYAAGYKYLGSYTDPEYQHSFSYEEGIHADTNIYMKRSDGFDFCEENKGSSLYDNLEIFAASDRASTPEVPTIGNISRTNDKEAVFIDFGYSPDIGDPFIELSLNVDISKSQVIHFVMKYFGKANFFTFYFTTLLNVDTFDYSVTGKWYTENFTCRYEFKDNEHNMSEDDEYVDIAVDMAALSMFNGYSVWGTSPYLGRIRIQPSYVSTSPTDFSNTMLLKRIYGSNEGYENGVETKDSDDVRLQLANQSVTDKPKLENGFVFPRDFAYAKASSTTQVFNRNEGLLLYFKNEIAMRQESFKSQTISLEIPTDDNGDISDPDKLISLADYKSLNLSLKNLGYATNLKVIIENDWGGKTFTNLKLDRKMTQFKEYSINLSKESLMIHSLKTITFEYDAVGTDNAIYISNIYFAETRPFDIPGVSFDDKNCFGMATENGDADISYNESYGAAIFDVKADGTTVSSTKTDINFTNLGYYGVSLTYSKGKDSQITGVYVSFKINNTWKSEYLIETTEIKASTSTADLIVGEGGQVTNIRFRFVGTGLIRIMSLKFVVNDLYCFDMAHNIEDGCYAGWNVGMTYSYSDVYSSSELIADPIASRCSFSLYLGIGNQWYGDNVYNCKNLELAGKSRIVIVYRNTKAANTLTFTPFFANNITANPDDCSIATQNYSLTLAGNMNEYQWNTVSVTFPADYSAYFLGKVTFSITSGSFFIRMVAVI